MLQQMLDNMQMMMGDQGGGPGENGQGQQSMQGLADALREQQGLADDSFQQLQREFRGERPASRARASSRASRAGSQAERGRPGDAGESLADRQEALRRADGGAAARPARRGRRGGARRRCATPSATWARPATGCARATPPGRSTARPRRSTTCARACARWARTCARPRRAARASRARSAARRPPRTGATRSAGRSGRAAASAPTRTCCPRATAPARARALLDEIRRRAGELGRPQIELDYLQRLLDLF